MNNQVLHTEKKQWLTPKMEIISKDVVQIGNLPSLPEGVPTPLSVTYGSGS